ncbi:copper chaperone [Ekhidna lutea]|uniref:Copper chaperone n=1 Tax=Ekhidna lutea TaxID=447679 RepID=A0A239KJY2_EKHLU|nr:heavy-metal-associated domain-containing protein [Ekhidna lutea]SNT18018.1 copper chaperone [Ekhidna lutea]
MSTLKFKTTIKCSGCLANVTPHLNAADGIEKWEVDIMNPNKILTVETAGASESDVIAAVEKAGYIAEKVN